LQILENEKSLIGVNTMLSNKLVVEAIEKGVISELSNYKELETEKKYGSQNSRIDILLTENDDTLHYIEIKNVSMAKPPLALFPDSVTTRGQKHLQELIEMVRLGHKATMLYVVNRNDCNSFGIAKDIDPVYDDLLKKAQKVGVNVLVYSCDLSENEIKIARKIL
jgi:sugar fermentation stimulation protein A